MLVHTKKQCLEGEREEDGSTQLLHARDWQISNLVFAKVRKRDSDVPAGLLVWMRFPRLLVGLALVEAIRMADMRT